MMEIERRYYALFVLSPVECPIFGIPCSLNSRSLDIQLVRKRTGKKEIVQLNLLHVINIYVRSE